MKRLYYAPFKGAGGRIHLPPSGALVHFDDQGIAEDVDPEVIETAILMHGFHVLDGEELPEPSFAVGPAFVQVIEPAPEEPPASELTATEATEKTQWAENKPSAHTPKPEPLKGTFRSKPGRRG